MSLVEMVFVVLGIIVGLGITEVLGGTVRILRGELRPGVVHGLWSLNVFLFLVQNVWADWSLRDLPQLSYLEYLVILWAPVVLFLAAALLFPPRGREEVHLEDYFMARRGPLMVVLVLYVIQAEVSSWMFFDDVYEPAMLAVRAATAGVFVAVVFVNNRTFQRLAPLAVLAVQIYWAIQFTPVQTAG